MTEQPLIIQEKGPIFSITLNRPQQHNALNNALMADLLSALQAFRDDPAFHVAVLTGSGPNFCSGADIKQFGDTQAQTPEAIAQRADISMQVHLLFSQIAKPIITSIRGYALAGGCGLALAGDLAVASETAVFGYPEIKRGFVPALVLVNLAKLAGRRVALELLLTGDQISASQALSYGLINKVVPDNQLEEATDSIVTQLAGYSLQALSNIKRQFYAASELSLAEGLHNAKLGNIAMRQSKDFAAGVKNFKAGVKP